MGNTKNNNTFGIGLGQIGGAAAGGIMGAIGANSQLRRQKELMDKQFNNQSRLNQQGHQMQKDMWEFTNYPNQVKMMLEAGLSPAMMYGGSGAGGTTAGGQGGGSAAGGSATAMDVGAMVNMARQKAEIDLLNSQKGKTDAERDNIRKGTEEIETNIQQIIANTKNTKLRNTLLGVETDIRKIEYSYTTQQVETNLKEQLSRINNLDVNTGVTQGMKDALIEKARGEASGVWITNALEQEKINLTRQQSKQIQESVKQKWEEISQGRKKLGLEERKVKIQQFAEEIKAEYPGIMQVGGRITNKVSDAFMRFETWITGGDELTWRVKK